MLANRGLLAALAALLLLAGECFAVVEPCRNYRRVSGRFMEPRAGHYHKGLDFSLPVGSDVYASDSGTVVWSGPQGAYGNLVKIRHAGGVTTLYGHLQRTMVSVGEFVLPGEVVGVSGNSGRSTGPHLHFEVRDASGPVDPARYLSGELSPAAAPPPEERTLLARSLFSLAGSVGTAFARLDERFGEDLPPVFQRILAVADSAEGESGGIGDALAVLVPFFSALFVLALALFAAFHAMRVPLRFLRWIFGPAGP